MQSEWLVVAEEKIISDENVEMDVKVQSVMDQIDEGKGWRYTEEQAETLTKVVNKLISEVKAQNQARNEEPEHESFFKLPFFKVKPSRSH